MIRVLSILALVAACAVRANALPFSEVSVNTNAIPDAPSRVELRQNEEGAWRFFVNEVEFPVRGAGGAEAPGLLEQLQAAGGNCVRTWGVETLEKPMTGGERFIDRAYRLGLMVVPGIWIQHERHGFNYGDTNFIAQQRTDVLAFINRYKHHPALLAWGLGNEMEGPTDREGSVAVLQELEQLARLVKAEDPNHPVMSVIAFQPDKVKNILLHYPSLDILGVNTYGGAGGVGGALKGAGWKKPFMVAEFGVNGFWEVTKTAWGAPLEPTSQEKARSYYASHRLVFDLNDGRELCLGTFAFLWGWKQECTPTWFGMFLPTQEKLPQVDAMTKAWTGHWPFNRCPKVESLDSPAYAKAVEPGTKLTAVVEATDPDGDALAYEWQILSESTGGGVGGEAEAALTSHEGLIEQQGEATCTFTSPTEPGNYRLYVTIRDHQGSAATANFPFQVKP